MVSGLFGVQVPRKGLRVRLPCPPLETVLGTVGPGFEGNSWFVGVKKEIGAEGCRDVYRRGHETAEHVMRLSTEIAELREKVAELGRQLVYR